MINDQEYTIIVILLSQILQEKKKGEMFSIATNFYHTDRDRNTNCFSGIIIENGDKVRSTTHSQISRYRFRSTSSS